MIIKAHKVLVTACLLAVMPVGVATVLAAAPKTAEVQLTAAGQKLEARYADRPKSGEGALQRLALATSLEHAKPIAQTDAQDHTGKSSTVDPVKRYVHYEKAYLDDQLNPAFRETNQP